MRRGQRTFWPDNKGTDIVVRMCDCMFLNPAFGCQNLINVFVSFYEFVAKL